MYRYQQRFEFFDDGSFRVLAINIGQACGTLGTYRPNLRIQFPTDMAYTFSNWDGNAWQPWEVEDGSWNRINSLHKVLNSVL